MTSDEKTILSVRVLAFTTRKVIATTSLSLQQNNSYIPREPEFIGRLYLGMKVDDRSLVLTPRARVSPASSVLTAVGPRLQKSPRQPDFRAEYAEQIPRNTELYWVLLRVATLVMRSVPFQCLQNSSRKVHIEDKKTDIICAVYRRRQPDYFPLQNRPFGLFVF